MGDFGWMPHWVKKKNWGILVSSIRCKYCQYCRMYVLANVTLCPIHAPSVPRRSFFFFGCCFCAVAGLQYRIINMGVPNLHIHN